MTAVLLFDGACGFCTSAARLLHRVVRPACMVLPYQQVDLARWGVTPERAAAEVLFVRRDAGSVLVAGGSRAIAAALHGGRAPWPIVGALLDAPGVREAADVGYRWVAANRHRLPGGTPACQLDGATAVAGAV